MTYGLLYILFKRMKDKRAMERQESTVSSALKKLHWIISPLRLEIVSVLVIHCTIPCDTLIEQWQQTMLVECILPKQRGPPKWGKLYYILFTDFFSFLVFQSFLYNIF